MEQGCGAGRVLPLEVLRYYAPLLDLLTRDLGLQRIYLSTGERPRPGKSLTFGTITAHRNSILGCQMQVLSRCRTAFALRPALWQTENKREHAMS